MGARGKYERKRGRESGVRLCEQRGGGHRARPAREARKSRKTRQTAGAPARARARAHRGHSADGVTRGGVQRHPSRRGAGEPRSRLRHRAREHRGHHRSKPAHSGYRDARRSRREHVFALGEKRRGTHRGVGGARQGVPAEQRAAIPHGGDADGEAVRSAHAGRAVFAVQILARRGRLARGSYRARKAARRGYPGCAPFPRRAPRRSGAPPLSMRQFRRGQHRLPAVQRMAGGDRI